MIWNRTKECMSRDELAVLQGKRLVKLVRYMYQNAEYYRKKMQQLRIEPGDIRGIEDLDKLPFTTKEDLMEAYPIGVFVTPDGNIIRYHSSHHSRTDTIAGYTQNDIDVWKECMARSISMADLGERDTIQVAYGNGICTDVGAERVGAAVISMPNCKISSVMSMMGRLHVTGIISPSLYLMHMVQTAEERELKNSLWLKAAICVGDPWPESVRKRVQHRFGIKVYDIFGLDELTGLGVACECECQNGMHIQEDFFLAEVIDPNTLFVLPGGMRGELVFTTLQKEGIPLIRYRTMNIAKIHYERCECGRTMARIERICHGTDDILFVRGNSVYAFQIEAALTALQDMDASYCVYIRKEHNLDVVYIYIESVRGSGTLPPGGEENMKCQVANAVGQVIGMKPRVQFAESASGVSHTGFSDGRKVTIVDERRYA